MKDYQIVLTKDYLEQVHRNIEPYIHRTPVLTSAFFNAISNANLFFKCENFQKVGAFKYRGATNAVLSLDEEMAKKGVATHSSGNHAQALALAAKKRGIPAYIVMPENAPTAKVNAVKDYGAEIIFCEATLNAREVTLCKTIEKTDAHFVPPYDDYRIIAGQSTAAKELIEDTEIHLDYILCPVGGGGLLGGTCMAAKHFANGTQVIAAEPEGANDAYLSFKKGEFVPSIDPSTIADGLLTSLGNKNFAVIKDEASDILLVNDEEIKKVMFWVWERMKIIIEPSAAVPLAAVLRNKSRFENKQVGIILSGGNLDIQNFHF